jgi:hypothetical protein
MKTTAYPMDNKFYFDALERLKAYPDFLRLLDQLHDELRIAMPNQTDAKALESFAVASDFLIQLSIRQVNQVAMVQHYAAEADMLHTRTTEALNASLKQNS